MSRLRKIRGIALIAMLTVLMPAWLAAQDDPNDVPLGDVARTLRKKTPPSRDVIDDDNLTKVMAQAEGRHNPGSALKFLMEGAGKGFQVSAPDVTCSLAFTANVKSLLSNQYAQMDLPTDEMPKLEGPATIEGDALIVSLYNRTDWHISELGVALTVVKKAGAHDASMPMTGMPYGTALQVEGANAVPPLESVVRPEKKPDVTVIYRMRAAAPPSTTTAFNAQLKRDIGPDEEWHWAIVQAKGYPPQSYADNVRATGQPNESELANAPEQAAPIQPVSVQPTLRPASAPLSQDPQ